MLVGEAMHTTTVTIDAQDSLPQAALMMQTLGVRRLLVLSAGKVVGLVTDGEVRRALLREPHPPLRQDQPGDRHADHEALLQEVGAEPGGSYVGQIMKRRVFTARPDDDLRQAIRTLLDRHVGGLPVLDRDGSLLGMLTLTDVLRAAAHSQPELDIADWGTVGRYMSAGAVTVSPETHLAEAAARLIGTRLRVLPVIQGQTLVGVLHQQDIRAAVARQEAAHSTVLSGSVPRGPGQVAHGQHGSLQHGTVLDGAADMRDFFVLQGRTVRDLMCPPGAEIRADASLLGAVQAMLAADVHGLPVVNGDVAGGDPHQFLGVITVSDVLRVLLSVTPWRSEHA
ncbi:CBS domain-containing protein [Deinococcus sp. UYEF24]